MKKHLLPILWLMLLTLPIFAETSTKSKMKPEGDFGISSVQPVDWPDALPMLSSEKAQAVGEIIDQEIEKAFAEGYKKGVLRYAPDGAYWKSEAQSEKARFWDGFQWGFGSGTIVTIGLAAGALFLYGAASR